MYVGRSLHHSSLVVSRHRIGTACRDLLHASAGCAEMLASPHDLPTIGVTVCRHQHHVICTFGRAAYSTSTHFTHRSPTGRALPRLHNPGSALAAVAQVDAKPHRKLHVCASTSVVDKTSEASTSQPAPLKFARRTTVKDVKVSLQCHLRTPTSLPSASF